MVIITIIIAIHFVIFVPFIPLPYFSGGGKAMEFKLDPATITTFRPEGYAADEFNASVTLIVCDDFCRIR